MKKVLCIDDENASEKSLITTNSNGKREISLEISCSCTNSKDQGPLRTKIMKGTFVELLLMVIILAILIIVAATIAPLFKYRSKPVLVDTSNEIGNKYLELIYQQIQLCRFNSNSTLEHPESIPSASTSKPHPNTMLNGRNSMSYEDLTIFRSQWLAKKPAGSIGNLSKPISNVIIHHTATSMCSATEECLAETQRIQNFHLSGKRWYDIGYNFLLGGDGHIYEGRGWEKIAAHTREYNGISLGVAFIGNFESQIPCDGQLHAFNMLMEKGVELQFLTKDYKIYGGLQFFETQSPGKAFYSLIKTWNHWSSILPPRDH